jgi:hypothetical protein
MSHNEKTTQPSPKYSEKKNQTKEREQEVKKTEIAKFVYEFYIKYGKIMTKLAYE